MQREGGPVYAEQGVFNLYPIFVTTDWKRLARTRNDIVHKTPPACAWPDFPAHALAIGDNRA
ncbi:MAG: hypothetical protein EXS09_06850 [Gemmataceae bacterium]|nr:hypothetical protein [Gemmataceae bacterium]